MDALQSCQEAIAAYNQVLTLAPDHVYTLNNKGRVLMGLSLVQMKLSQPQEVLKSWKVALAAYTRYLEIAPVMNKFVI
jgi:tetratricopeptide (TPR) repeat protein